MSENNYWKWGKGQSWTRELVCNDGDSLVALQPCHVIVRNRSSLSMGSRRVAAGANPSLVSGRGQGTPWTSCQLIAGPSLKSKVGFSISLKVTLTCSSAQPRAGIWTSDLPITGFGCILGISAMTWLITMNITDRINDQNTKSTWTGINCSFSLT